MVQFMLEYIYIDMQECYMSKYDVLWKYLKDNDRDSYKISYDMLKGILGFGIDHSFQIYKKDLEKYGYYVSKISMKEKVITFNKI